MRISIHHHIYSYKIAVFYLKVRFWIYGIELTLSLFSAFGLVFTLPHISPFAFTLTRLFTFTNCVVFTLASTSSESARSTLGNRLHSTYCNTSYLDIQTPQFRSTFHSSRNMYLTPLQDRRSDQPTNRSRPLTIFRTNPINTPIKKATGKRYKNSSR